MWTPGLQEPIVTSEYLEAITYGNAIGQLIVTETQTQTYSRYAFAPIELYVMYGALTTI